MIVLLIIAAICAIAGLCGAPGINWTAAGLLLAVLALLLPKLGVG